VEVLVCICIDTMGGNRTFAVGASQA